MIKKVLKPQNINYIYDGTFYGFMTAVYDAFEKRLLPENFYPESEIENKLFSENIHINTDYDKSEKLINLIKDNFPKYSLKRIIICYLSEIDNFQMIIFNYIKLGWSYRKKLDNFLDEPAIFQITRTYEKVLREKERFLGIIRFKVTKENIYYSTIEPDYNIIPLIPSHFAKRMPTLNWIIHDTKRDIAIKYINAQWIITEFNIVKNVKFDNDEIYYQELWKNYFKNIAIKERTNKKLQKQFLPQRYWKNLIELTL